MKIEFTRAEIERILLDYTNHRLGLSDPYNPAKGNLFNTVEGSSYRGLPDTIIVSAEEKEDAAQ